MTDFNLLTGKSYLKAIKRLLSQERGNSLQLAVSYWGNEAIEATELLEFLVSQGQSCDVRVICDLGHPACRHEPIQTLLDQKVEVRRLARLHAKVWVGQSTVIIGSANMSKSAMQLNNLRESNYEAGVYSDSVDLISLTKRWFDELWASESCVPVGRKDLEEKYEQHKNNALQKRVAFSRVAKPGYKTFESLIGETAGIEFREALEQLGFQYSGQVGTRNMRMNFVDVDDTEYFVSKFVDALKKLVQDSENKRSEFTGESQERIPPSLYEVVKRYDGTPYQAVLTAVKDLVERHGDRNLRLRGPWKPENHGKYGYSIRLANEKCQTDGGSATVANIQPTYIRAGGSVPKWDKTSTRQVK